MKYDVDIYDGEWHTYTQTVDVTHEELMGIRKLMDAGVKAPLGQARITLISLSLEGLEDYGEDDREDQGDPDGGVRED